MTRKEIELMGLPIGLVLILALILLTGGAIFAMGVYFGESGHTSPPPCERYSNLRAENVPARCLDYFRERINK